jgi:hypothetical protein
MAWIAVDLDGTLIEIDPETQEEQPIEGAVEAMHQLAGEGHRLTVFTARFTPMPQSERERLSQEIEEILSAWGFPPMEIWSGMTKPNADIFIDNSAVTFDGSWGLTLAQTQSMLEERGLVPGPQPGAAGEMSDEQVS